MDNSNNSNNSNNTQSTTPKSPVDESYEMDDYNSKIENEISRRNQITSTTMNCISSDNTSLETHLSTTIRKLRERVIIYEHMCYKTAEYYSKWNRFCVIPSLFLSAALAIYNSASMTTSTSSADSTPESSQNTSKIVNVVLNGSITLILSVQNTLKIPEKSDYFFNLKKKFTKLHNSLNNEILDQVSHLHVNPDILRNLMKEYEVLDENINYEFPRSIINDTKKKFHSYSLPTVCNGIQVVEQEIQTRGVGHFKRSSKLKTYSIPPNSV
jgi:hypothetical protein